MLQILILIVLFSSVKASCSDESVEWQNYCYIFQTDSTGFAKAVENCAKIQGSIVSIHDGFLNALLAQESTTYLHESTVSDFWIGLTSLMKPGSWTWMDGTVLDFDAWKQGEPQNATGASCAALSISDGYWRAEDCFKTKPYVCKVDESIYEVSTMRTTTPAQASTTRLTTTSGAQSASTTTTTKFKCSDGFIYFEPTNSCYSNNTASMNWNSSEKYCQSMGGHLTSIHTDEEFTFVKSISAYYVYYKRYWTGAHSDDKGKTWLWSDGTPWDYNSWGPGANGTGYCSFIDCGGIYTDDCNGDPYMALCKIKL